MQGNFWCKIQYLNFNGKYSFDACFALKITVLNTLKILKKFEEQLLICFSEFPYDVCKAIGTFCPKASMPGLYWGLREGAFSWTSRVTNFRDFPF